MRYEPVRQIPMEQLILDLESSDSETVAYALYSATTNEQDTDWAQNHRLKRLTASDVVVRRAAVTCLGDLASLRRRLDTRIFIPALERAAKDLAISDPASFSLSMVKQFLES